MEIAASPRPAAVAIGACPRCSYQGQGVPYFTRGPHMAALIGITLFTMPMALGAGGILYYVLRREHRICPRCGEGWGRDGDQALEPRRDRAPREERQRVMAPAGGGIPRAWSVILLILGAILLVSGIFATEPIAFGFGLLGVGGGYVLHRVANRASEARRQAMIASLQTPVLKLASERGGKLTVTDVAASLNWSLQRAEKILNSLDDGWRVSSDITDDGVIVYGISGAVAGSGAEQ